MARSQRRENKYSDALDGCFAPPQFYHTDSGGIRKLPQIRRQSLSFGLLKGRLFSDNLAVVTQKS
jgi:hypothetical protein